MKKMKKQVGILGSFVLGAAMVTVGLPSNDAMAFGLEEIPCVVINCNSSGGGNGGGNENGDGNGGGNNVPEPASIILLGAGLAGLGIWKRKAMKL